MESVVGSVGGERTREPKMVNRIVAKVVLLSAFVSGIAAAQQPRKDVPAIAKAANGAVVSIIMSNRDGKPIVSG